MIDEIVEKLKRELETPITSERQVVYVLIEIRKLLDRMAAASGRATTIEYPALLFFCNWIAHTALNSGWAQEPLNYFEKHAPNLLSTGPTSKEARSDACKTLTFDPVRDELISFLKSIGLARQCFPCDPEAWVTFLLHYTAVVSECPLTIKNASRRQNRDGVLIALPEPEGDLPKVREATVRGFAKSPKDAAESDCDLVDHHLQKWVLMLEWKFVLEFGLEKVIAVPLAVPIDDLLVFNERRA